MFQKRVLLRETIGERVRKKKGMKLWNKSNNHLTTYEMRWICGEGPVISIQFDGLHLHILTFGCRKRSIGAKSVDFRLWMAWSYFWRKSQPRPKNSAPMGVNNFLSFDHLIIIDTSNGPSNLRTAKQEKNRIEFLKGMFPFSFLFFNSFSFWSNQNIALLGPSTGGNNWNKSLFEIWLTSVMLLSS